MQSFSVLIKLIWSIVTNPLTFSLHENPPHSLHYDVNTRLSLKRWTLADLNWRHLCDQPECLHESWFKSSTVERGAGQHFVKSQAGPAISVISAQGLFQICSFMDWSDFVSVLLSWNNIRDTCGIMCLLCTIINSQRLFTKAVRRGVQ